MLHKEGPEEEAAHQDVERDDAEELGHDHDPGAEVAAGDQLGVGDLERGEQEVDAPEGEVDREKGAGEIVQGGPQGWPHQDVRHRGTVDSQAEHAEGNADGGRHQPQGVVHHLGV